MFSTGGMRVHLSGKPITANVVYNQRLMQGKDGGKNNGKSVAWKYKIKRADKLPGKCVVMTGAEYAARQA